MRKLEAEFAVSGSVDRAHDRLSVLGAFVDVVEAREWHTLSIPLSAQGVNECQRASEKKKKKKKKKKKERESLHAFISRREGRKEIR